MVYNITMQKLINLYKKYVVLTFYNEWEQFDSSVKWNWITGTLIHIYFEKEWHGYQFQITLLGIGFFLRVNTEKSLDLFDKWTKESEIYEEEC